MFHQSLMNNLKEDLKVGDKVLLENILFYSGNSTIIPESEETMERIARVLVEQDHIYFTIRGHVCCTKYSRDAVDFKTKKRNLSLVRAKYIYNYLAKRGVDKKRMKYVGMRRKFPLGGDPKYDRRVEILITYASASRAMELWMSKMEVWLLVPMVELATVQVQWVKLE